MGKERISQGDQLHQHGAAVRRNHNSFGHQRERMVADVLREEGWQVFRSAGSFGVCDLIALRESSTAAYGRPRAEALMVEVKGTARSPWVAWGPHERHELREAARLAGAQPVLAWWPPNGSLHWFAEAEWPVREAVV
jgi:Holliday junction resolvase